MNPWSITAAVLAVLTLPSGLLTLRGRLIDRVAAMQLTATISTLSLLCFSQAANRDVYFDLAVLTALLATVGTFFYVRIVESWL